ncbi:hypothetical protein [Vibrio genomosp. F10]|nr:hypothetical protein [Vibrio genomosp. F10]OEF09520.1 hypothetical protein A1QI_13805 [Vibrio genomosp. F10 str. 9ZB36]
MKYAQLLKSKLAEQEAQILNSVEKHKAMIQAFPMSKREQINSVWNDIYENNNVLEDKNNLSDVEYSELKRIQASTFEKFESALDR